MVRPPEPVTPVLSVAAAWWLFSDVTAAWGPSLITLFGQAAATPPELMGAYALGCVLAAFVVVVAVRWQPLVPLGIAVAARLVLALQPGDQWQLWSASVGVAAALAWLAVVTSRNAGVLATGVAAGWAVQVSAAAIGGTWLAVWRLDVYGVLCLLVLLVLLASTARGAARPPGDRQQSRLTARQAWSLLPVCLVMGVAFNPGRASAIDVTAGPVLLVLGCVLAVAATGRAWQRRARVVWGLVAVAAVAASLYGTSTPDGVDGTLSRWVLLAVVAGPAALASLLQEGPGRRESARTADAMSVLGGGVVWVLLFFAYYAGYDLGYRADLLLVAVTAALAILAVRRPADASGQDSVTLPALVALGVVALALAPRAVLPTDPTADPRRSGDWKVVTYNVRMGYGMDGRFDPEAVADLVRDADVVLLQEVDRGWLLNGGQDQLAVLSRLTDKELYFGPAADPVWGDAILTDLPVAETRGRALPSYGAVTGAGWLAARVEVDGTAVWVVSTHVQPTDTRDDGTIDQARDLAAVAAELGQDGTPVVLGGDFNLEPGSPSFTTLTEDGGLVDALARWRPVRTSDSEAPVEEIDHVLVSPVLAPVGGEALSSTASDHLPVRVRLRLAR